MGASEDILCGYFVFSKLIYVDYFVMKIVWGYGTFSTFSQRYVVDRFRRLRNADDERRVLFSSERGI